VSELTFYHYPSCSTCKRALAWLMEHNISVRPVHIVETPPSVSELEYTRKKVGGSISRLFNTSGQLYREGNYKERLTTMTEAEALAELSHHGKLIKRPLLIGKDVALVGFRAEEYEDAFVSSDRS
jgi:arsenate reductase (glutaredoxin)